MIADSLTRVGVFGGSFNPPHLGHQIILGAALGSGDVDLIWVLPTFRHAFGKQLAPYDDRVAMCERLAIPFANRVVVSRLESELGGESRTLPLLVRMTALLPSASLRLMIGADILAEAHKWLGWDEVAKLAPPLIFGRAGHESVDAGFDAVHGVGDQLTIPDISSTEIRRRLACGDSTSALLPIAVSRYIVSRELYRS